MVYEFMYVYSMCKVTPLQMVPDLVNAEFGNSGKLICISIYVKYRCICICICIRLSIHVYVYAYEELYVCVCICLRLCIYLCNIGTMT
jgi:hypothetical protein